MKILKNIRWFRTIMTGLIGAFALCVTFDYFYKPYRPQDSVVRILNGWARGTGVIVKCEQKDSGFYYARIYTVAHLVPHKSMKPVVTVFYPDKGSENFTARVITIDNTNDFCLLEIDRLTKELPVIRMPDRKTLYEKNKKGDPCFTIGCSLGGIPTMKRGLINWMKAEHGAHNIQFLSVNAPAIYGDSGGAVVNAKGELLGIISRLALAYGHPYEHQIFAIPVSLIEEITSQKIHKEFD